MIERCVDICLSQGRPDLKVQCVASWLNDGSPIRLRANGGARGDGGVRKDS